MRCMTTASILATAMPLFAAPLEARQNSTTLQPWELSSISTFSPSGRPGSYPWATIIANLVDPNKIIIGTSSDGTLVTVPAGNPASNCTAKWLIGTSPTNHIWPCDPSGDGYWTMELLGNSATFSSTNYDVRFTRVVDTLYQGSEYKRTYVGSGHFEVGVNLEGTCGGSGVCSWGLKAEDSPTSIQQVVVTE